MEEGSTDLLNEAPVSLRLLLLACLLISARTTKHKRPCERHHREEMLQQYRYLKSLSIYDLYNNAMHAILRKSEKLCC